MTEDGLATPIDFTARYGSGLDRGIVLGGGGVYFIAWQVAYLQALARGGVDLSSADRVVGTSAGSVVATALTAGHLGRLHAQVSALSRFPALLHALAPAVSLTPSQQRALDAFVIAPDADAERVRAIGRAALAANTPEAARIRANLQLVLQVGSWPSPALHVTAVDAYTGERCVVTESAGVRPARAAAASSAVPGLFPPQPLLDRKAMDGGVSGTGLHLDVVAGARRALVLALSDGSTVTEPGMTIGVGRIERELASLEDAGTRVLVRTPMDVDRDQLMSPEAVPDALASGARQGEADRALVVDFWA